MKHLWQKVQLSTYRIPAISNNSNVHKTYRQSKVQDEEQLQKIYDKELVAFPLQEQRYNELLNIKKERRELDIRDYYFNPNMYINVKEGKINNIVSANFGLNQVDKYFLFQKEYLDSLFFEGLAGELNKDIIMHSNGEENYELFLKEVKNQTNEGKIHQKYPNLKGVGILYRKMAYEIISEMKKLEEHTTPMEERESYHLDQYFQNNEATSFYDNIGINRNMQNPIITNSTHKKVPICRRILIDGKRGTGKSCILNTIVLYAKLKKWFVIFVPDVKKYKFDINTIVRSNSNLYIQPELSKQFLEQIIKGNENFLKQMKTSRTIINQTCLDGTHTIYNKRMFDEIIRKTIDTEMETEESFKLLNQKEKQFTKQKLYKFYYDNIKIPNLLEKFPFPNTLLELVQIGANHSAYANLCIYALFEHLKKQTQFPLLIATDMFNYNLGVSEYLSIRFENTKYNGYIPTYYFTIPKLLIDWSKNYKRCFKIAATSWDRENRRNFRAELLGIDKQEIRTARNFTLREFKNYVAHLYNQNVIYDFDIHKMEYFFMLTGGNGFQARKLLSTLF